MMKVLFELPVKVLSRDSWGRMAAVFRRLKHIPDSGRWVRGLNNVCSICVCSMCVFKQKHIVALAAQKEREAIEFANMTTLSPNRSALR